MVTSVDLMVLAASLPPPNDEIMQRAAHNLALYENSTNESQRRDALETAHNLVTDVAMNLVLMGDPPSVDLLLYEDVLAQARINVYGAIGRPADMMAPYWKNGW